MSSYISRLLSKKRVSSMNTIKVENKALTKARKQVIKNQERSIRKKISDAVSSYSHIDKLYGNIQYEIKSSDGKYKYMCSFNPQDGISCNCGNRFGVSSRTNCKHIAALSLYFMELWLINNTNDKVKSSVFNLSDIFNKLLGISDSSDDNLSSDASNDEVTDTDEYEENDDDYDDDMEMCMGMYDSMTDTRY